jgi:hypothetical protein
MNIIPYKALFLRQELPQNVAEKKIQFFKRNFEFKVIKFLDGELLKFK